MRKWLLVLLILFLLACAAGFYFYKTIFGSNVDLGEKERIDFYINTEDSLEDLKSELKAENILQNEQAFDIVSMLMQFTKPKPGLYELENGMSNRDLISLFRAGRQKALKPVSYTHLTLPTICSV